MCGHIPTLYPYLWPHGLCGPHDHHHGQGLSQGRQGLIQEEEQAGAEGVKGGSLQVR